MLKERPMRNANSAHGPFVCLPPAEGNIQPPGAGGWQFTHNVYYAAP